MWIYESKEVESPGEYQGFVYLITNKLNGKKYIGKKNFVTPKTRYKTITQKNGIKKRKKLKEFIESDWKDYFGSNKELLEDVEKHGPENFERKILVLCQTKGDMTYWESYYQFVTHSLLSEEYYNTWIMCRVRADHIKEKCIKKDTLFKNK